jgi:epoxyqueuosine reductase
MKKVIASAADLCEFLSLRRIKYKGLEGGLMIEAANMQELLKEEGIQSRVVPVARVADLEKRIARHREEGHLSAEIEQRYFPYITFDFQKSLEGAKSIVIASIPRPSTQAIFDWKGKSHHFLIPPTYSGNASNMARIQTILSELLYHDDLSVVPASLPKKLLAVCSGLGEYGRNNICYVPGFGSYHQLVAFYTEVPCPESYWREPVMMAACQDCLACLLECPSGAITDEHFPLRADRCITFPNENPGPLPGWLDLSWLDCLVGCLRCQRVCPENEKFIHWVGETETFSGEETAFLLQGPATDKVPAETRAKLERLEMFDMEVVPRNLRLLLRE